MVPCVYMGDTSSPRPMASVPGGTAGGPRGPGPEPPEPLRAPEKHALESLGEGSFITLIGQLFTIAAVFGSRVLLVRSLSNEEFGVFTVGLAITALVGTVANLGIPTAVARQLAHTGDPGERKRIVRTSFYVVLLAAAATGTLLWLAGPSLASALSMPSLTLVADFLAANLALGLVSGLLASYFQGVENVYPNTLFVTILNPLLTLVFLVGTLAGGLGLVGALLSYVAATAATLVGLSLYTLRRRGDLSRPLPKGREEVAPSAHGAPGSLGALLWFSLPLSLVGLATTVTGNVDTLAVGFFSPTEVSAYSAILPLAKLVTLAVGSLSYIMLPVAARLHRWGDMEELRRSYATITKWILLGSVPFFLLFFFLPIPSLDLVYGTAKIASPPYASAATVLRITVLGAFLSTVVGPSPSVLVGLGKLRWLVMNTVLAALVDVVGSLALVPLWGVTGAAVAFAISLALLPVLSVLETYLLADVHPFTPPVLRPLLAVTLPVGVALGVLVWGLHWTPQWYTLVALFFLFAVAYFLAVPGTRSLEGEDSHLLRVAETYLGRRLTLIRSVLAPFVKDPSPGEVPEDPPVPPP